MNDYDGSFLQPACVSSKYSQFPKACYETKESYPTFQASKKVRNYPFLTYLW